MVTAFVVADISHSVLLLRVYSIFNAIQAVEWTQKERKDALLRAKIPILFNRVLASSFQASCGRCPGGRGAQEVVEPFHAVFRVSTSQLRLSEQRRARELIHLLSSVLREVITP